MDLFILIFAALFSVINLLGTVPVFVGLTLRFYLLMGVFTERKGMKREKNDAFNR